MLRYIIAALIILLNDKSSRDVLRNKHLFSVSSVFSATSAGKNSVRKWPQHRLSAKTTLCFSKLLKTAQNGSIFAKNEVFFGKNGPKIAKSGSKRLYFGIVSLLRRCFWAKNADRKFPLAPKTFISPYKKARNSSTFTLIFIHRLRRFLRLYIGDR